MKLIDTLKQRVEVTKKIIKEEHKKVWLPCQNAYNGKHWKEGSKNYVINLIWSTIETEIPLLFFGLPKFKLKPTSSKMTEILKLKNETILNKIIGTMPFVDVIRNTILAAYMSFGMVEWGCDSEFIDNPKAGQPYTQMVRSPQTGQPIEDYIKDLDGNPILEPDKIVKEDSFYIKRIKATDAGFDPAGGEIFEELSWYWVRSYMTKKEVMKTYNISSKELTNVGYIVRAFENIDVPESIEIAEKYGLDDEDYKRIAVYKMYDRVKKKVYIFCDGIDTFLDTIDFPKTEPHAVLKFNTRLGEFYQNPEIFPLLDPQTQIEIAANMRSEHMLRNARKVWRQEGAVENTEAKKLEDPYTMSVVTVKKGQNSFGAIDFGPADSTIYAHEAITQDQFNQIKGQAGTQRGGASKKATATAEMIQDRSTGIRPKAKALKVRDFLIKVGNGIKNCIDDNLTLSTEIEILGKDEQPHIIQLNPTIDIHKNFDAELDIKSFAAPFEEMERVQWLALLDIMGRYPHIFTNPTLAKETLLRHGIESEDLQRAIVEMTTQMIQNQMLQQMGGAGGQNQKGSAPAAKTRGPKEGMAQLMGSQIGR